MSDNLPPDHYNEARRLVARAENQTPDTQQVLTQMALTHALLALVANGITTWQAGTVTPLPRDEPPDSG